MGSPNPSLNKSSQGDQSTQANRQTRHKQGTNPSLVAPLPQQEEESGLSRLQCRGLNVPATPQPQTPPSGAPSKALSDDTRETERKERGGADDDATSTEKRYAKRLISIRLSPCTHPTAEIKATKKHDHVCSRNRNIQGQPNYLQPILGRCLSIPPAAPPAALAPPF